MAAVNAVMVTVVVAGPDSPTLVTLNVQVKVCAAQGETSSVLVKVFPLLDSVSVRLPPLLDVQVAPVTVSETVIEAVRVTVLPVFITTEWSAVLL